MRSVLRVFAPLPSAILCHGVAANFAALSDGQVATIALDACANQCKAISGTGSAPAATVLYGGAAPGIVAGVSQFNIEFGPVQTAGTFFYTVSGPAGSFYMPGVWVAP